ncbi:hypothetical protein [Xanthomonas medicagonis]|uniref:hypothetical protein n=1 Tax=Xanthomonas medicagonis TaxID=3160841 RepID=UPI003516FE0B
MLIQIAARNIAPSAEDARHDVYLFSLDPDAARPFCLSQSIRGGQADSGGSVFLGLHELEGWRGDWRQHLRHAGCAWAIAPIEAAQCSGDVQGVLALLVAGAEEHRLDGTPQR